MANAVRIFQVEYEVTQFLQMLDEVYGVFGLEYTMALSTRPEGYLGELSLWDKAEAALEQALQKTGARISSLYTRSLASPF